MATIIGALSKTKADTLYEPMPAPPTPAEAVRPASPTFNDVDKTFVIPASTKVDYYEWQPTGFVLVAAGTHTRVTRVGDLETRIRPYAKPGYVVYGPSQFAYTYTG